MTSDLPACPECGQPMKSGGLVLSQGEDDGRRVCRSLGKRTKQHVWWGWADRTDESVEICPVPQLFR